MSGEPAMGTLGRPAGEETALMSLSAPRIDQTALSHGRLSARVGTGPLDSFRLG